MGRDSLLVLARQPAVIAESPAILKTNFGQGRRPMAIMPGVIQGYRRSDWRSLAEEWRNCSLRQAHRLPKSCLRGSSPGVERWRAPIHCQGELPAAAQSLETLLGGVPAVYPGPYL